jgi:hypothetical protein
MMLQQAQALSREIGVQLFTLYNTATEQTEGFEHMDGETADARNQLLRDNGEPQRWVRYTPEADHANL